MDYNVDYNTQDDIFIEIVSKENDSINQSFYGRITDNNIESLKKRSLYNNLNYRVFVSPVVVDEGNNKIMILHYNYMISYILPLSSSFRNTLCEFRCNAGRFHINNTYGVDFNVYVRMCISYIAFSPKLEAYDKFINVGVYCDVNGGCDFDYREVLHFSLYERQERDLTFGDGLLIYKFMERFYTLLWENYSSKYTNGELLILEETESMLNSYIEEVISISRSSISLLNSNNNIPIGRL